MPSPNDVLVDVCMPTYETSDAYLHEAVGSVMAQTEKRWMLHFHDDCSKKDIHAVVERYLGDPRVTFKRSPDRLRIGGNWNATIRQGKAPYIAFLFPDDVWGAHYLEAALKVLEEHPDVDFVSLNHHYFCPEGGDAAIPGYKEIEALKNSIMQEGRLEKTETLKRWLQMELHPNIIGEPCFVMLRRSLYENVGPYLEDMPQNLDMEYSLRCLVVSDGWYLAGDYGGFRVHSEGTSAKNQKEGKGVFDRFRCFENLITILPPGEMRSLAIQSRNNALAKMAAKFFARLSGGRNVAGGGGSGAFKTFAMKHPLLTLGALARGFFLWVGGKA